MKILIIHNHYLEKGGEDEVVRAEASLLRERGHEVILYEKFNEDVKRLPFFKKLLFILKELSLSGPVYREVKEIVKRERPDIAHIHNIFVYITPSVYFALKEEGIPIVQSLHNYRFFCIKGTFYSKGAICEKCKNGRFFNALLNRCWRNSYILSFFLARLLYKKDIFMKNIDAYIASSEFSKNKFVELGLEEKRINLKTNFLTIEPKGENQDQNYALFLGRLADYKGIKTLLKAFEINPAFNLKIIGDGPMRKMVSKFASSRNNIEWLGRVGRESVLETIKNSSFVIFPSECYENMPIVIIESFAFSKPVVASNVGAVRGYVIDRVNGILFEPGNAEDLAVKVSCMFSNDKERVEMGKNANKFYREQFGKEKNYNDLMDIYTKTLNLKKGD